MKKPGEIELPNKVIKTICGDGSVMFELNPNRKIEVKKYKGVTYIDVREYFNKGPESLPTKKGVAMTKDTWVKLKGIMEEIDDAMEALDAN